MKFKYGIRFLIFLLFVILLFPLASRVFSIPSTHMTKRFNTFYKEPENSLDVVYIGSSAVDRFWAAPLAWGEYGIAVYPLSTNAQPIAAVRYLIEESLKTQNPEVFLIDVRGTVKEASTLMEARIRNVTDNMRFSMTRFKAIDAMMKFGGISTSERVTYYLSFFKYHTTWEDGMTSDDFTNVYSSFKGTYLSDGQSAKKEELIPPEKTETRIALLSEEEEALRDLLSYCKDLELNVLFLAAPYQATDREQGRYQTMGDIIREYGYSFINYNNSYEEIRLDYKKDFYNYGHVNVYGSYKFTRFLSEFLIREYALTDKRGNMMYASWDESYDLYVEKIRTLTKGKLEGSQ